MREFAVRSEVFWGLVGLGLAIIYLPGLGNPLVFDDDAVTRALASESWTLWPLRARALTNGTFFWVDQLAPDALWFQRVVSLLLHAGVTVALYGLFKALVGHVRDASGAVSLGGLSDSHEAALRLGAMVFALNPVAVYGVAYLTQRSIVMATLFSVLACWAFIKGLSGRGWIWFPLAAVSYLAAMLSKEHAVLVPALFVPLYIFVRRPDWRRTAGIALVTALLLSSALWIFRGAYSWLMWQATAETWGPPLLTQLEAIQPGIEERILLLGITNQMTLFFVYGFLWLVPVVGWMSVDLRPPFPLSPWAFPYWLGVLSYLSLLLGSAWAVIRRSDLGGFVGLCMLAVSLLFAVEFVTVRLQEPLVLYRSYLWAIPLPGLVWAMVSHLKVVQLHRLTLGIGLLLALLAFERQQTFRDDYTLWTDAIEKMNLDAGPETLGRWRAFINRGNAHRRDGQMALAEADYARAIAFGEVDGGGYFGFGTALQAQGLHADALSQFDSAQVRGFSQPGLYYHRGEALFGLERYAEALQAYQEALSRERGEEGRVFIRMRLGEAANAAGQFSLAKETFESLVADVSPDIRFLTGLGLALLGIGDYAGAEDYFDVVLDVRPVADALYGRARSRSFLGNRLGAREDITEAVRMDPSNPQYLALQERLRF